MTKILAYVGGSFAGAKRLKAQAQLLEDRYGFKVLSMWWDEDDFIEKAWDRNFAGRVAQAMALRDFHALLDADVFIVDTMEPSTTGGRYAELGFALARAMDKKLHIIHIGPPTNIFETLVQEHYATWEEFFGKLDRRFQ
jgi:hypothetical protein